VIEEGKPAPDFELTSDSGDTVKLSDLKGKQVVVYFYPKDDTPGCTKQACAYRDEGAKFKELGVKLFGVSADDLTSHEAFRDKFSLNFPLISDPEHKLADFFGSYGDQEWQGRVFKGLSRDTFLIDPNGKVAKAFRRVNPTDTVGVTYEAIKALL